MERLLTIGIPTYNRGNSLRLMLKNLEKIVDSFAEHIEIIISDNCSLDETPEIISDWVALQSPSLAIKRVRHSENIGLGKNVVSLFYAASSSYLVILGDDDRLNYKNFPRIMKLLVEKKPSAIIQASWEGQIQGNKKGTLAFDDALGLFYEYGNAWAGIVDRIAAVRAIESRFLLSEIEVIVWPQTVFGFLAMYDLSPMRSIEAVDFEIGSPLSESLNITNKSYWIRSLTDLLKAADIVQRSTGNQSFRKRFLSFRSRGFVAHVKAIFWNAVVDDDRTSLVAIRKLLRDEFGWRGWGWSIALSLDNYPRLLYFLLKITCLFRRADKGRLIEPIIEEARRQRKVEIFNKEKSGKRMGDWF